MTHTSRRTALAMLAGASFASGIQAQSPPLLKVTKDPGCGCCQAWIDHMRAEGFRAEVVESAQINRVKTKLNIPKDLWSCHTAEIGGYVLEGHVPAGAVRRLMVERPVGSGLAVPGMPVGSPGMEIDGASDETYSVILFGGGKTSTFAQYRGRDII